MYPCIGVPRVEPRYTHITCNPSNSCGRRRIELPTFALRIRTSRCLLELIRVDEFTQLIVFK